MKRKYFIQQFLEQEFMHGGITCVDAEKILLANGFAPVSMPYHYNFSIKAKIARFVFLLRTIISLERGSVVVFLFPVYARMNRWLIGGLRRKGITTACIIADIEGLRDSDERLLNRELRQLKKNRFFIVHNQSMRSLIEQRVGPRECIVLNFFDFLTRPQRRPGVMGRTIVFAGNLEKSGFLNHIDKIRSKFHFNLYGPGLPEKVRQFPNVSYLGTHKPYDTPAIVQGSFGLIWDGESIDSCTGGYGQYLHYNSQHKLSLYILSFLPVIVWKEAATAELVMKYGIGFTIDNLDEIETKIDALSEADYRQMQRNMEPLAERISTGGFLSGALEDLMSKFA